MKKLKMLSVVAAIAGMGLLTSCLKGNNSQSGVDYGVLDISKSGVRVISPAFYQSYTPSPLYISQIANDFTIDENACIFFTYAVDMDTPENANMAAKGYYTGTTTGVRVLDKAYLSQSPVDSTVMPKELALSAAGPIALVFDKKKLVIAATHKTMLTEQKNRYELFCDMVPVKENTNNGEARVYNLFLRSIKVADGKAPSIEGAGEDRSVDLDQFYQRAKYIEQSAGKEVVNFKISYVKEFNADTTAIKTWGASEVVGLVIPKES